MWKRPNGELQTHKNRAARLSQRSAHDEIWTERISTTARPGTPRETKAWRKAVAAERPQRSSLWSSPSSLFWCCISMDRQRGSDDRGCHRSSECCITAIMEASVTSPMIRTRGRRTKQNTESANSAYMSSFVPSQRRARARTYTHTNTRHPHFSLTYKNVVRNEYAPFSWTALWEDFEKGISEHRRLVFQNKSMRRLTRTDSDSSLQRKFTWQRRTARKCADGSHLSAVSAQLHVPPDSKCGVFSSEENRGWLFMGTQKKILALFTFYHHSLI